MSDLSNGWVLTDLGQVVLCLDKLRVPVSKKEREKRIGEIPYYGANGLVGWIDDFLFNEPLVLVVEDETFVGRKIPFSYKIIGKSWVNNHAHVLRPTKAVDVDYLNYSLQYYPFLPLTTGTTGRKKLTQKALLGAPYKLPPLAEQQRIVDKIEELFSDLDSGINSLKTAQQQLKVYRQAVLKWAFEGKLTAQWREEQQRQGKLESADTLLAQIKAEREQRYQKELEAGRLKSKHGRRMVRKGRSRGSPRSRKI
jgi:type I restriction enzyme S subunit